jgi:hypothetical protein
MRNECISIIAERVQPCTARTLFPPGPPFAAFSLDTHSFPRYPSTGARAAVIWVPERRRVGMPNHAEVL